MLGVKRLWGIAWNGLTAASAILLVLALFLWIGTIGRADVIGGRSRKDLELA